MPVKLTQFNVPICNKCLKPLPKELEHKVDSKSVLWLYCPSCGTNLFQTSNGQPITSIEELILKELGYD